MEELQEELQIDNALIGFDEISFEIIKFTIDHKDLILFLNIHNIKICSGFNTLDPNNCFIQFSNNFDSNFQYVLEIIYTVSEKNACLSANLSSYLFQQFTGIWNYLNIDTRYIIGIQLWKYVLNLITKSKFNDKIHKGTIYYWTSVNYLWMGDFDAAFTFLFNALEEDRKLEKICPKYPNESPSFFTLTLSTNENNFMLPYVLTIREKLQAFIDSYNKEFSKQLDIDEMISLFQKNKSNKTIFFFFVFNLWSIFEYQSKIYEDNLIKNDYSKLKNSGWLFNICLVIDTLLQRHTSGNDTFVPRVYKYIHLKNWLKQHIFQDLYSKLPEVPDNSIPKILNLDSYDGNFINTEIRCLLIACVIRNFSAHNVELQNIFVEKFDELLKILLFDVFIILEEYRW